MASQPLAPWVVPPNFLAAIEAGASTGLRSATLAQQGREASDRINLGYAHLRSSEDIARTKEEAQRALGELRAQDALQRIMQGEERLQLGHQALEDKAARHQDYVGMRERFLDLKERGLENTEQGRTAANELRKATLDLQERGLKLRENTPGKTDPFKLAKYNNLLKGVSAYRGLLTKPDATPEEKLAAQQGLDVIMPQLQAFEAGISRPAAPGPSVMATNAPAAAAGPAVMPMASPATNALSVLAPAPQAAAGAAASPFAEGAIIRRKGDTNLYQVVNGVPVPVQKSKAQEDLTPAEMQRDHPSEEP